MFPIEQHTVFLTLAGSQAHGTAREGSDVDVRGVCIAPLQQFSMRWITYRDNRSGGTSLPNRFS